MNKNIEFFLWSLKIGAILNIYFLYQTFTNPLICNNYNLLIPSRIFFLVSIYRCLFPVNYVGSFVFHKSIFSSVFITRLFATFSEVAMIYQISFLLYLLNINNIYFINLISVFMVIQVIISQFFVWGAILTRKSILYFYEELGWFIIYFLNTSNCIFLFSQIEYSNGAYVLIVLNILFGIFYLPWQFIHLKTIYTRSTNNRFSNIATGSVLEGFNSAIKTKNFSLKLGDWGGVIGLTWMFAYWASIMPLWIYLIVRLY